MKGANRLRSVHKEPIVSDEYLPEDEFDGETDFQEEIDEMTHDDGVEAEYEVEEINVDEVDRVVAALEELIESVESENIKAYLDEASTNIYYLIYEDDETADDISDAA
jgi:hypothetical protein